MSRHCVAFAVLALAGAALFVPEPSVAAPAGARAAFPGSAFRAPIIVARHARGGMRHGSRGVALPHQVARPFIRPASQVRIPPVATGAFTTLRFVRLNHRRHHHSLYPVTIGSEGSFIGTPYDPGEAIPVYAPAPDVEPAAEPAAPPPRFSSTREENHDACRSERVTVPATEGEREITVVRC